MAINQPQTPRAERLLNQTPLFLMPAGLFRYSSRTNNQRPANISPTEVSSTGIGAKAFFAAQTTRSNTMPIPAMASASFCFPLVRLGWGVARERLSIKYRCSIRSRSSIGQEFQHSAQTTLFQEAHILAGFSVVNSDQFGLILTGKFGIKVGET